MRKILVSTSRMPMAARLEKELARSKGMLSNEKFLSKAPEAKVQEEKDKLAGYEQMITGSSM